MSLKYPWLQADYALFRKEKLGMYDNANNQHNPEACVRPALFRQRDSVNVRDQLQLVPIM